VLADKNEYLTKDPNFQKLRTSLVGYITEVINRFVQTGRANKGKTTERLSQSEETVED
jgi:hypothetical protein